MSKRLLDVRDLGVRFLNAPSAHPALQGLSYSLHEGETLAIVGESGSGKTVGCRALLGLLPSTAHVSGSAWFMGQDLLRLREAQWQKVRGAGIALIFQDPGRSLNPTMRVGNQIVESVRQHQRLSRQGARTQTLEILHRLALRVPEELFHAYPHQLSGGMQQRIMIGIALASRPRVLIADEPTKSLDVLTQARVLRLMKDLQRQRDMALVLITHDLRIAASTSSQLLIVRQGRVVEQGNPLDIFNRPKTEYTRALLGAIPGLSKEAV